MPTALETTHVVMARTLIVYQRERSAVWQCRYRVNRRWQRASTGEHELPKAIAKAHKMYITAEVRHSQGPPVVSYRRWRRCKPWSPRESGAPPNWPVPALQCPCLVVGRAKDS